MAVTRSLLVVFLPAALVAAACRDAPVERAAEPPAASEPAAAALEGRFTLAADRGRALPTALEPSGGCAVELVAGSLTLSGGRFLLATTTRERCAEATRQESRVSEGAVTSAGGELRLDADRGSAFRSASGRFAGDSIRLTALAGTGGVLAIDWTFAPRR